MSEKYKKIIDILNTLNLSDRERQDFLSILLFVPDNDYEAMVDEIEKNPNLIKEVLENYKVKKDVLASGDKDKWQQVVEQEKKELESL